jgi:23S rRNA pseudouridine1911/1915/1917 synthase
MESEETPSEMRFESEVRSEQRNLLLAEALAARFTYHSQAEWQQRIEAGDVLVAGAVANGDQRVKKGDKVTYIVRNYSEPPVPTHFEILYEDEEFLVAGKPAGIPVHHTGTIFFNTFTSVLRRGTHNDGLIPMHRLDRDTSGVMLFAKSQDTSVRYQKSLAHILLRKIYLAVAEGNLEQEGVLDVNIPLCEKNGNSISTQMVPDYENGKTCHTRFRKVATGLLPGVAKARPISVVECELFTGRKHQIRAHLAALGHPIVGDVIYNFGGRFYLKRCDEPLSEEDFTQLGAPSQLLHAFKVELQLPGWREPRWIESRIWTPSMAEALHACGIE